MKILRQGSILIAMMFFMLIASAQEGCPETAGCATIQLPDGIIGDFYLGETPLAVAQNAPVLQIPPGRQQVIVRNVISSDPNFNVLFVYQEVTVNVSLRGGQSRAFPVRLRQQFIRGTLQFTCQIASQQAGENVACSLSVDGVYLQDVPAGQSADVILDPGGRAIQAQVVGEHAWLWASAVWTQSVNIVAGRSARARSQFAKLGHIIVTLNQPGAVGDIFINGELVASQVASADRWVAAGAYTVDVRNITDPAGAGVYRWLDAAGRANVRNGRDSAVAVRLKKELLPTPVPPAVEAPPVAQAAGCDCSGNTLNCPDFSLQSQAQECLALCMSSVGRDVHDLDRDSDGIACETLP